MVTETALLVTEPDDAEMITTWPSPAASPAKVHVEVLVQLKLTAVVELAVQLALTETPVWPPEKVPVAVRVSVGAVETEIVPDEGETWMDCNVPLVTVNDTEP